MLPDPVLFRLLDMNVASDMSQILYYTITEIIKELVYRQAVII